MSLALLPADYAPLLSILKERVRASKYAALKAFNTQQVAIELKVGKFQPEFAGKMQFYLAALDRQVRQADETPSMGIILCREKSRTIVEYALHDANKPIGVATYQITSTLPQNLAGQLAPPEAIAALLEGIEK